MLDKKGDYIWLTVYKFFSWHTTQQTFLGYKTGARVRKSPKRWVLNSYLVY